VIGDLLIGAVAAAATVVVAASAGADPSPYPSPYSVLGCDDCPQTVKKGGPPITDQMNQGIQAALTPGQPAPHSR